MNNMPQPPANYRPLTGQDVLAQVDHSGHRESPSHPLKVPKQQNCFSKLILFPQIAKLWALTSNNNELPARAFEAGCWCWAPVLALVL